MARRARSRGRRGRRGRPHHRLRGRRGVSTPPRLRVRSVTCRASTRVAAHSGGADETPLDRSVGGTPAVNASCFAAGEVDAAGRCNRCPPCSWCSKYRNNPSGLNYGRLRKEIILAIEKSMTNRCCPMRKLTGSVGSRGSVQRLAWRGVLGLGVGGVGEVGPITGCAGGAGFRPHRARVSGR